MTLRAYVVDDEALAVKRLTRLLDETRRVDVIGSTTDPEAALAFLQRNRVDILFLDVQMPGLSGFELLERLDWDPIVVFTTAYDRYAIDAFSVNSIDYLLKPIEPERLDRAIDKLEKRSATDVRALARELASHLRTPAAASSAFIARPSSMRHSSRSSFPESTAACSCACATNDEPSWASPAIGCGT